MSEQDMNLFEGTGVKRYALRCHARPFDPWEYPLDLQFDTLEEARAALDKAVGLYELVERYPSVRYEPGRVYQQSPIVDRMLELMGCKPYALQVLRRGVTWETCGEQFDTLEEAQAAAALGQYRVACACWLERWEPVREAVT